MLFDRIGRIASEDITLQLINMKCIPILLYGLEACPLLKSDISSLDLVVNRLFMKLFKTSNKDVVKCCQDHFGFDLPSVSWSPRVKKFEAINFMLVIICCVKLLIVNNGVCNLACI